LYVSAANTLPDLNGQAVSAAPMKSAEPSANRQIRRHLSRAIFLPPDLCIEGEPLIQTWLREFRRIIECVASEASVHASTPAIDIR
jgi:hypothetical protein